MRKAHLIELKQMLHQAGFTEIRGKGSHTNWIHPLYAGKLTVSGKDGNDAKPYQEKNVQKAIDEVIGNLIAVIIAMRYTLFFTSSLFPLPSSLFPLHCSLLPAPCSLKPIDLYLMGIRLAIIMIKLKYQMIIQWSEEDNCFLVGFPDFPGQQWRSHGDTYEEAVNNGTEALESLVIAYQETGENLPEPTINTAA